MGDCLSSISLFNFTILFTKRQTKNTPTSSVRVPFKQYCYLGLEYYNLVFAANSSLSSTRLQQQDLLDEFMYHYNDHQTHRGYKLKESECTTPSQTFYSSKTCVCLPLNHLKDSGERTVNLESVNTLTS